MLNMLPSDLFPSRVDVLNVATASIDCLSFVLFIHGDTLGMKTMGGGDEIPFRS